MDYLIHARGIYRNEAIDNIDGMRISEGTIAEIAPYGMLCQRYAGIHTLELGECWLFPGLFNTHVHLEFSASDHPLQDYQDCTPELHLLQASYAAKKLLCSGVTTARDAGSSWAALTLRHPQAQRIVSMPRLLFAGPPLTVTGGHLHFLGEETDGIEDMLRQVRIRHKRGCDAVKLIVTGGQMTPGSLPERVSLSTDEICTIVDESHRLGLPTLAHCLTTEGFRRCMLGGVDCIEHIACFVRNSENGLLERRYVPEIMEAFAGTSVRFMMGLSAGYHLPEDCRNGNRICSKKEDFLLEQEERMFAIFRRCCDLGLKPVCGTDAGTRGTYFDETWLEVALMTERGGLTPNEAIRAATSEAAACIGVENITGSLDVGLSADIIALSENPLEKIRSFAHPSCVISQGNIIHKCM